MAAVNKHYNYASPLLADFILFAQYRGKKSPRFLNKSQIFTAYVVIL